MDLQLALQLAILARLAGQRVFRIHLALPPDLPVLELQVCTVSPGFSWVLGISLEVLMFSKQALYPLIHLPSTSKIASIQIYNITQNNFTE